MRRTVAFVLLVGLWLARQGSLVSAEIKLIKADDGVEVRIGDQLFTKYLFRSGAKPILWPVNGVDGMPLTRAFPMAEVAGEEQDHVHQRSCWFTHGNVNGVDFWSEQPGHGEIVHRELLQSDDETVATRNDWLNADGKRLLTDERTLKFAANADVRQIDFNISLLATDGPITFGDTKEGSFGLRVASSMRVEANKGGESVSSEGLKNEAAWGKQAAWVDYHGPVGEHAMGIAVLNHPSSFGYPTRWHVRPYGLFAANPFGEHEFGGSERPPAQLDKGKRLTLRYRVMLHRGDDKQADIAGVFARYAELQ